MSTAPSGGSKQAKAGSRPILHDAIELLDRGFRPIVIYSPGHPLPKSGKPATGKEPFGKDWGVKEVTPETLKTDVKFFTQNRQFNRPNIGLSLGPQRAPGGGWLIDIEGDGPEAESSRLTLFDGESIDTIGWNSARGSHQIYRADEARLSALSEALKPFQVKGANQPGVFHIPALADLELRIGGWKSQGVVKQLQSVCPPSVGTDGKPREWLPCETLADAPEAFYMNLERLILEAVPKPIKTEVVKPIGKPSTKQKSAIGAYLAKALANEADRIRATPEGQRRDTYRDKAFALAGWLHYGEGYTEDELRDTLKNALAVGVSYGDPVVNQTVDDAIRDGKARPRTLDIDSARRNGDPWMMRATGAGIDRNLDEPERERPEIEITTEEKDVNDQAVKAIANDPDIFHLGEILATVIHGKVGKPRKGVEHLDGPPPRISPIETATLRERLAHQAVFFKYVPTKDGGSKKVRAHPPAWSVPAVMARGYWPGVRPIVGVVETPTMRPDGSILSKPGYDPATALFYHPSDDFPQIPEFPTRKDAKAAADSLLALVGEFPFTPGHEVVWLAGLLSVVGRAAYDGSTPLFAFDANCPGTGKSMLADIIAIIASLRRMARTIWPTGRDADEEMRKRITALLMTGELTTLLDNIPLGRSLGGAPLDSLLTSMTWKDRILGKTQTTPELPNRMVCFANGNNLMYGTDILRRLLPCRLVTTEEKPEERQDFTIPDLLGHVKANRSQYLVKVLTILRAYHVAGRPKTDIKPLGSYVEWSMLIAAAVKWSTDKSPLASRETLAAEDTASQQRQALFEGLSQLPRINIGLTSSEIRELVLQNPSVYAGLKESLMEFSRNDDLPTPRAIGDHLRKLKERVISGQVLKSYEDSHSKVAKWNLVKVEKSAGSAGSCGVSCQPFAHEEENGHSLNGHAVHTPSVSYHQTPPHHPADPALVLNGCMREPGDDDDIVF